MAAIYHITSRPTLMTQILGVAALNHRVRIVNYILRHTNTFNHLYLVSLYETLEARGDQSMINQLMPLFVSSMVVEETVYSTPSVSWNDDSFEEPFLSRPLSPVLRPNWGPDVPMVSRSHSPSPRNH
jgi:hypothetical protein